MGVDAADYDGSGRASLVIGNFSNEMMALYTNEGNGLFIDEAPTSTIGRTSLLSLTFACFFFDYDLDGWPRHLRRQRPRGRRHPGGAAERVVRAGAAPVPQSRRPPLRGRDRAAGCGAPAPTVARGAAYGDIDRDGDLDLLVTANNGRARLLRNDGTGHRALRIDARAATTSNRDAIGARVTVTLADGSRRWQMVKTGSSYLSQSELPLTFGLGASGAPRDAWKSRGRAEGRESRACTSANEMITVEEGRGIVSRSALKCTVMRIRVRGAAPFRDRRSLCSRLSPRSSSQRRAREERVPTQQRRRGASRAVRLRRAPSPRSAARSRSIGRSAIARLNLAIALLYAGQPDAAAAEARAAVQAMPASPHAHYVLGLVARGDNRNEDAIAAFTRVLQIDPSDAGSRVQLAQMLLAEQQYPEAIRLFDEALRMEPFNATAAYGLAMALTRSGEREKGAEALKRFEQLRGNPACHHLLVDLPRTGPLRRSDGVDRRSSPSSSIASMPAGVVRGRDDGSCSACGTWRRARSRSSMRTATAISISR